MAGKGNPNFGKPKVVEETSERVVLETQEESPQISVAESQKTDQEQTKEATIPVSQVAEIVAQQVAEAMKKIQPQTPEVQREIVREKVVYEAKTDVNDIPELENWEMRDRIYILSDGSKPISFSIRHQHYEHSPLNYTNRDTQVVHGLRYASNQTSFFIDQQSKEPGSVTVPHITFWDGMLKVSADNILLQKFLAIHPDNGESKVFKEFDPKERARKQLEIEDLEFEAQKLAREVGDVTNRAVASVMCMGYTEQWDMGDVKAEIFSEIKKNPKKYIELASNNNVKIKGIARTAVLRGYLKYSNYRFYNEKNEVILEVQRNQDEYDAIADFFNTGEGRSYYEFLLNAIQ